MYLYTQYDDAYVVDVLFISPYAVVSCLAHSFLGNCHFEQISKTCKGRKEGRKELDNGNAECVYDDSK